MKRWIAPSILALFGRNVDLWHNFYQQEQIERAKIRGVIIVLYGLTQYFDAMLAL